MKLRVLELFAGIGANTKALAELGIPHEVVGFSEIDKYAISAFCTIHGVPESLNYGDIAKLDPHSLPDCDLLTGGFPCQDISVAGNQAGMKLVCENAHEIVLEFGVFDRLKRAGAILCKECGKELKLTRSGLYLEMLRVIQAKRPSIVLTENVKNLTSKKFREVFQQILKDLEELGYKNYWKVLNAKDYGIPQNRERVFIISIRDDIPLSFEWPEPFDNGLRLKDFLEPVVDEHFYISEEKCAKLLQQIKDMGEYSYCITSNYWKGTTPERFVEKKTRQLVAVQDTESGFKSIGNTNPSGRGMNGNVYMGDIAPTLTTNKGEGLKIAVPCMTPDLVNKQQNGRRFKEDGDPMYTITGQDRHGVLTVDLKSVGHATRRGAIKDDVVGALDTDCYQAVVAPSPNECNCLGHIDINGHDYIKRVYDANGTAPTIPTGTGGNHEPKTFDGLRIRKLTALECWRLMGQRDEDYYKVKFHNAETSAEILRKYPNHKGKRIFNNEQRIEKMSDTQLYKQAGNSIVVDKLACIYTKLVDVIEYILNNRG